MMKNLAYFIIGLILLPIGGIMVLIKYIKDYGETFVSNIKFRRNWKRNLKRNGDKS